jgi:hypothetical protein
MRASRIVRVFPAIALAVLAMSPALNAAELHLVLHDTNQTLRDGVLRVARQGQEEIALAVKVPGSVSIDVGENEIAHASLDVPGFWSETQVVTPAVGPGVSIDLWPAVRVAGRLASAGETITKLRLEWQTSRDRNRNDPPDGQTDCDLENQEFRCLIPSGDLDFTMRAEGYIPKYWWNEKLQADQPRDLGKIKLIPGASVSGMIDLLHRERSTSSEITLSLIPATDSGRFKEDPRRALTVSRAVPNKRGFFQFLGVAPGLYTLSAEASGHASEELEIEVIARLEARLREPIVLRPPKSVTVTVDPPTDPWGRPWRLTLSRYTSDSDSTSYTSEVDTATVATSGVWKSRPLPSAKYLLTIGRAPQGEWFSTDIELLEDLAVDARVPLTKIRGTVRLGTKPVEGVVWFGGEHGQVSIPVAVREDGTFRTILPRPENDVWREIDVVAQKPMIRRTLTDVPLTIEPDDEAAVLDIQLPSRAIFGEVVDMSGRPIAGSVFAKYEGGSAVISQFDTDESGTFSWEGLEAGALHLRAETSQRSSETSTRVVLPEEESETPVFVRLTVKQDESLAGKVISDLGPVAGARLTILQKNAVPNLLLNIDTDMSGEFQMGVRPGTARVDAVVSAPGFATRMLSLETGKEQSVIRLERTGGTLVLDVPAQDARSNRIHLIHGDLAWVPGHLAFAVGEGMQNIAEDRVQLTIPGIEAGDYSLCFDPPIAGNCMHGHLSPFGKLDLRVRKQEATMSTSP